MTPEYKPLEDFNFRVILESLGPIETVLIILFPTLLIISIIYLSKYAKGWSILGYISTGIAFIAPFIILLSFVDALSTAQSDVNAKVAESNISEKYDASKIMLGDMYYNHDKSIWIQSGSYVNEDTGKAHDIEFRFATSGEPLLSLVDADEKPVSNDEYKSILNDVKVAK